MKPDCRLEIPVDPTHNAFAYVIEGNLEVDGKQDIKQNHVVLYERGDSIINLYAKEAVELLVMGGKPLNEPVYAYGPFVMNTEDAIRKCYEAYSQGKMGNPDEVNAGKK